MVALAAGQGSTTDLCVTATSADATETELHDEWHACDRTGRGEQLPSTTVAVAALVYHLPGAPRT